MDGWNFYDRMGGSTGFERVDDRAVGIVGLKSGDMRRWKDTYSS